MLQRMNIVTIILICIALVNGCSVTRKDSFKESIVRVTTTKGSFDIKLYDKTPIHRDNFIKLVENQFYDSILFHRVILDFMIQAGDQDSKTPRKGEQYGGNDVGYTIEGEFDSNNFHRKGAIAAARQGDDMNPEKRSSGSQFYIVVGKVFTENELKSLVTRRNDMLKQRVFNSLVMKRADELFEQGISPDFSLIPNEIGDKFNAMWDSIPKYALTDEMLEVYTTQGGSPHLDGDYSVFGEVINGIEVVEEISRVKTDQRNRPIGDISIVTITLLKK